MCGMGNVNLGKVPKAASERLCRTFFGFFQGFDIRFMYGHAAGCPTDEFEIRAELAISEPAGVCWER